MATSHSWTYLSNHAHVLICLAHEPTARLRDVAERVGITERAVQTIVTDLEASGAITRIREGRRNRYRLHHQIQLRHPVEAHRTIGDLLAMTGLDSGSRGSRPTVSGTTVSGTTVSGTTVRGQPTNGAPVSGTPVESER